MSIDIVRAWTDEAYRRSLSPDDLARLPAHPAGQMELLDVDLATICGGAGKGLIEHFSLVCSSDCLKSSYCFTFGPCCQS
ncbi:mersacidin/lichenicidin family type 2 lantibiotic [Dictyobacter arantiisoli]|uniref:Mersacidin/lichenicidin family type 2 lantibiotic n=1 Tax=Dictyobacter arantiisoli TaxID=2014874 RepID=A0A5A5TCJ7_9CHLR|nr:mersacidin/lichenicidin family type 2 lantibiotic [Dictyobacter arantiisoli]GCF08739.1 hypothetical protein KDI_23030 [Dictyobacter arantiisoli]